MCQELIGRENELEVLQTALHSNEAEMIAVIGRIRVGKTFLVKSAYQKHFNFHFTGIQDSTNQEQLQDFSYALG